MTTEEPKKGERHERAVAIINQLIANKKNAEKEAIEEYRNSPEKQALVAELDRRNAERGTPIVRL